MTDPTPSPQPASPSPASAGQAPAPGERRGLPAWVVVLIVVGGLGVLAVVALLATAATILPRMQAKQARFQCTNNLSQLGGIFVAESIDGRPPAESGPALFLEWRKSGRNIREGQESVLLCPLDPDALPHDSPDARARWDDADLAKPARGLCSYAVRDFASFPLDRRATAIQPVAACLDHTETGRDRGGAVIAFDDGSTRFFGYEELGISDKSELTVGPQSKAELLRTLTYGPAAR